MCQATAEPKTGTAGPRVPMGVYARIALDDIYNGAMTLVGSAAPKVNATARRSPHETLAPIDAAVVNYITVLLDNPAVSGIAAYASWGLLSPGNPGPNPASPAAGAYNWGPLDDLFTAVGEWNSANAAAPPKTIQLILLPGFATPGWVLSDIDDSVCGTGIRPVSCTGSCDGMFMTPYPSPIVPQVSHKCGYTTLFYRVEGEPQEQLPFPLPWNAVYKNDWKTFLTAVNKQILLQPSSSAFVTISVAGPTASSEEMILPSTGDQKPGLNSAGLLVLKTGKDGVVPPGEKPVGFTVPDAWNALLHNFYAPNATYQNSDLAFVDEWNAAIDAYGKIFSGITLALTTTTDALPDFPEAASSLGTPAPGFESDCDPTDPTKALNCSAVTQVLAHFTDPTVGGKNAKSTQEDGMTAARDGSDLGTNAVKWLATISASGTALLPGTSDHISRILGGMQFSHSFTDPTVNPRYGGSGIQAEGCPTFPKPLCTGLTPSQGLDYVQKLSFFPGTLAGPVWDAPVNVDSDHWVYSGAPMNYVQIYDNDIRYAAGLSTCSFKDLAGNPAKNIPPDLSACQLQPSSASFADTETTQEELQLTNDLLLAIAEPSDLP
jgi:hypothetical protein